MIHVIIIPHIIIIIAISQTIAILLLLFTNHTLSYYCHTAIHAIIIFRYCQDDIIIAYAYCCCRYVRLRHIIILYFDTLYIAIYYALHTMLCCRHTLFIAMLMSMSRALRHYAIVYENDICKTICYYIRVSDDMHPETIHDYNER